MKVLRLHGPGDLHLHDEPVPTPGPDQALVRVMAVGLCGSDLHWFSEGSIGDAALGHPLVLGHEFAGLAETGERVAVDPAIPCGACEACSEGNPNLCTSIRFMGHSAEDGALREQIAVPRRCLFPLPPSFADADGAMLEPLGVALHAVDLGHVKPGMSVGVFGCGSVGLLIVQLARAAGATTIIATDPLLHRLDAARAYGAATIRAEDGREAEEVWAAAGRRGVDVAFEAAGADAAVATAIATAKPGARVVLVGIPDDDRTTFTASVARRKGLTLKLSRRMKHTYPRAIRLVTSGQVDVRSLVTHRFPLHQFAQAFATAQRREGIKVVIEP
ncbi:MAG: zinc-binding dehydrogenase [Chloroflexi bacterium]|nr:zinc-binding dehydrogenase [Chloroflexota bacterium]